MRTTLLDAKQSRIPVIMNVSPDDERFVNILNEAQQRLVQTGEMFWGLFQSIQFCVRDGCLVMPRQVASVISMAVCNQPITLRNQWFEYLQQGPGIAGFDDHCNAYRGMCASCYGQSYDRGTTCTFSDIAGLNKKVRVYADVAEDPDAVITIFGYDQNKNFVRTEIDGVWTDGERVGISTTPQTSYNIFTSITGVQKPNTNGNVRLYEYNTDTDTQRPIAEYEPTETNPNYRKMFVSGHIIGRGCRHCGQNEEGDDVTTRVTIMAKMEYIPARVDTDWLLIANLPALKDEIQSVMKYEMNLADEGAFWHAKAIAGLRAELRHYIGAGIVSPIRMAPRNIAGAGVRNML